jgi:hypothetical protein
MRRLVLLALLWPTLALGAPQGFVIVTPDGQPVSPTNPLPLNNPTGTYLNGGVALSVTATQIFAATPRVRIKLLNNSGIGTTGGTAIVMWCRWGTVGAAPAVAGGAGSFALQPNGGGIDDQGPGVNQSAVNCLSESGTPTLYAEQY